MNRTPVLVPAFLVLAAAFGLVACGGGHGGGGSGAAAELSLVGTPLFGVRNTMTNTVALTNFRVDPINAPGVDTQVAANNFANAAANEIHFLEFHFSTAIDATTITSPISGQSGIEVYNAGTLVPFFLDSTGAIDATNAFTGNAAPATLRLYFQASGQPAGTTTALANDTEFRVDVITTKLKSSIGRPLCLLTSGGICASPTALTYSFGTGMDTTPIGPAANPSVPLLNAFLAIDDEIRVFFSENIDFRSIVGVNTATGGANVTQRDPFMSRPFPVNNLAGGGGTSNGENLSVVYTAPAPALLPPQYSFVLYMPDPFHAPNELRIRFVDGTFVQPSDTIPNTQNYGIDNRVYSSSGIPGIVAPVNRSGLKLNLPPKLPLPGSNTSGTATLAVNFFSPANANASDTSSAADGILGVADRSRNALANDFLLTFNFQNGPVIANNQIPPDLHLVPNGSMLGGVSASGVTADFCGAGATIGLIFPINNVLADSSVLTVIRDIEIGAALNGGGVARRTNNAGVASGAVTGTPTDPGIPFPPGGTPEAGCGGAAPAPPLGFRLYVTDDSGTVKVLSSNTFLPLGVLSGVPSAWGLGVGGGGFLYVSNHDQATTMRIGINPAQTTTFHQVVGTATVGNAPTAVSGMNAGETVCVLNSGDRSMSVLGVANFAERDKFPIGNGAHDVIVTDRHIPPPGAIGTLAWSAYIPNTLDNNLTVFESDSVNIQVQNGPNGRIIDVIGGFSGPRDGIYNQIAWPNPGLYTANSTGGNAVHFNLLTFGLQPPPGFAGVPAFRNYQPVQTFTTPLADSPFDITIDGVAGVCLLITYSTAGQVACVDRNLGTFYGSVNAPGLSIHGSLDQ